MQAPQSHALLLDFERAAVLWLVKAVETRLAVSDALGGRAAAVTRPANSHRNAGMGASRSSDGVLVDEVGSIQLARHLSPLLCEALLVESIANSAYKALGASLTLYRALCRRGTRASMGSAGACMSVACPLMPGECMHPAAHLEEEGNLEVFARRARRYRRVVYACAE